MEGFKKGQRVKVVRHSKHAKAVGDESEVGLVGVISGYGRGNADGITVRTYDIKDDSGFITGGFYAEELKAIK